MSPEYDVIVIGGGPSGSTCSTLLARRGRRVLLLEREVFPRFHIGESLTLFAPEAFRRLGVYEELAAINYVQKRGLEFVLPDKSKKIYFAERCKQEARQQTWTFQMSRAKLDGVLLKNAEANGVIVRQQHAVQRVLFEGDRAVGVSYIDLRQPLPRQPGSVYARWLVDCSGQNGVINRQLKNNCFNDQLLDDKIAIFSHWTGDFEIVNGETELNFKLCVHPNRKDWFWWFPIDRNLVSIGVVIDRYSMRNRDCSLEELFMREAAETPFINEFFANPSLRRTETFRSVKDFSYRSRRYHGNGWVLAGDSAGFLDPIFSTGLQICFNTSFKMVDVLDRSLDDGQCLDTPAWQEYEAAVDRLYRINSTLVYKFYQCGIDFEEMERGWCLLGGTHWVSPLFLLRFLYHGAQLILRPRSIIRSWARDVLFGNIQPGNKIAELFLVLNENYEELSNRNQASRAPRQHFVDLET
jgi:flavin-dependent dehydrogenase